MLSMQLLTIRRTFFQTYMPCMVNWLHIIKFRNRLLLMVTVAYNNAYMLLKPSAIAILLLIYKRCYLQTIHTD